MARKPKAVSAWLGGNRGTVQSGTEAQVDTGGGEKDAVNRDLALGLAAVGGLTLAGAGLYKSGLPARALNKVTGQTVVVHGTPNKITGSVIKPKSGSNEFSGTPLTFGFNPRGSYAEKELPGKAASFSRGRGQGSPNVHNTQGNVVVGKVKKSLTVPHVSGMENEAYMSASPIKIKSIIKAPSDSSAVQQQRYISELKDALRKAGAPLRSGPTFSDRIEFGRFSQAQLKIDQIKNKIRKNLKK